jgi:hypothetical protein
MNKDGLAGQGRHLKMNARLQYPRRDFYVGRGENPGSVLGDNEQRLPLGGMGFGELKTHALNSFRAFTGSRWYQGRGKLLEKV